MIRLKTIGVLLFIVLFVASPLYEVADVGEHWPHDGAYASMVSSALFLAGFTRVLRKSRALAAESTVASQAALSGPLDRDLTPARNVATASGVRAAYDRVQARLNLSDGLAAMVGDAACPRFVILRDFRL